MSNLATTVAGRSCEGCALCCKLPEIKVLDKPAGSWCIHCPTHQKCDYYENRPDICRNYHCAWMTQADIDEAWRPITSRMMINYSLDGLHLLVIVDPSRPDAWRRAPYLQHLKNWARINNAKGQQIIVSVNRRCIVIFPDREQDLGVVGEDESVGFEVTHTVQGPVTKAYIKKRANLSRDERTTLPHQTSG